MRVLHAYNLHRGGGGADNATRATVRVLRDAGLTVTEFVRDSALLRANLAGKLQAFASGLYARRTVAEFEQALQEHRSDLVHVHELYPLLSPWLLPVCTRQRIPVVMSVYDYRLTCPTHNHFHQGSVCTRCIDAGHEGPCVTQSCRGSRAESVAFALRNLVARKAGLFTGHVSRFITPTHFAASWLAQHAGIAPDRLHVVPCEIALPEQPVDDPSQGEYALFAGRLVPEKGVHVAMEAARLAEVPLRIAVEAVQDLSQAQNGPWVRHMKTHNPQELAAMYRGARFLVMPSVWFETFGIVVAEAMAHGVPVIASRIGALAETTQDGITGLHVPPGDAQALARQMRRLWDDPSLCRQLGRQAHAHVAATSSAQAHLAAVLAVYEETLRSGVDLSA